MGPDVVVVLRSVVALHRVVGYACWGRPNEVLRLPLNVAAPLIRARLAVLADQHTPLTRDLSSRSSLLEGSAIVTAVDVTLRDPRTCVSEEVWEREVQLIMRDNGMDRGLAERTFGQTVAYLVTSAENPGVPMGPTPAVDKGVHSFVLDTPRYWDFCMQYAGMYLHHIPHLPEERAAQPKVLHATIQAIRASGFPLDEELWGAQDVDCHQCYACCANSPGGKK